MKLEIKVFGNVQGVGFRYSAKEKAVNLGVQSFARNEPDESVYVEAEGDRGALQEFLRWCREESPGNVEKIKHEFSEEGEGKQGKFKVK